MTLKHKILLVEDDANLAFVVKDSLQMKGYEVTLCGDGKQAIQTFKPSSFQVCLVDVMLPYVDGFAVARHIREHDKEVPILFLTAKSMTEDKLEGFKTGADDYITKPFNYEELLVRVENANAKVSSLQDNLMNVGLKLIPEAHSVMKDGVTVNLTSREFIIFNHLYKNQTAASTREELISQFDKEMDMTARNIDVHIFSLRKKMNKVAISIETVWGTGYKIVI